MRSSRFTILVVLCARGPGALLSAQQPPMAARQVGEVVSRSADSIGSFGSIRPLSDGRVLVNDAATRRLILLDAALAHGRVLADTTAATGRAYGTGLTGMVPFSGDSTLIQDGASNAFVVIDPDGNFSRIIPAPRAASSPPGSLPLSPFGFDRANHLLYRPTAVTVGSPFLQNFLGDTSIVRPDSTIIRRVAFGSWRVDTIGRLQIPKTRDFITRSASGGSSRSASSPILTGDDVALLPDGTLAIVRARDYHIDWIGADGRVSSAPPIPTLWVPLSDAGKAAVIDSIRVRDSVSDARAAAAAVARGDSPMPPVRVYVKPADLPDHQPPFIVGSTRADAEGNVWIQVNAATATAGPIFDVVNRQGQRLDRVQLPPGAVLAGFAPGVVFFSVPLRPPMSGRITTQLVVARIH